MVVRHHCVHRLLLLQCGWKVIVFAAATTLRPCCRSHCRRRRRRRPWYSTVLFTMTYIQSRVRVALQVKGFLRQQTNGIPLKFARILKEETQSLVMRRGGSHVGGGTMLFL